MRNRMMRRNGTMTAVALAALLCAVARAKAEEFVWIERGAALAPIVLAEGAGEETARAAEELADYAERITGARPEILAAPDTLPQSAVFVGLPQEAGERFAGVDLDFAQPEEVLIACTGSDLLIAGRDIEVADQQVEFGTANAVYEFIEKHLDVRWLWPGPLGEDIVERDTLSFAPFTHRFAPPFRQRDVYPRERGALEEWTRRHRNLLDSLNASAGHAFNEWWDRYHEDHPDYFALQPDGTRSGHPRPSNAKLCQSNPAVWAQWLANVEEKLRRNPAQRVFNASPNDSSSSGICICENCRAWDSPEGQPWRLSWSGTTQDYVAMTDRYMTFSNHLAERLERLYPERDFFVYQMAYGPAKPPPVHTTLRDNVMVGYVGHFPVASQARREEERGVWAAWAEQAPRLVFRPNIFYYSGGHHGIPTLAVRNTLKDFAFLAQHRGEGIILDGAPHHFSPLAPQLYAFVKMSWDPLQDGEALMEDFYRRGFGEAAEPVAAYYAVMEEAHMELLEWPRWRPSMGNRRTVAENLPAFYTEERLDRAEALLDEAEARVADGPPIHRERVAFVRHSLDYTRNHMQTLEAMNRVRASGGADTEAVRAAMRLCEERDEIFERAGSPAFNAYRFNITWTRGRGMEDYVGPPKDEFLAAAGLQRDFRWTGGGDMPIWSDPKNWETLRDNRWVAAEDAPGPMDVARLGDACPDEPQRISLLRDARVSRIVLEATGDRRDYAIASYEHGEDDMLDADTGMIYRLFLTHETPLEVASEATRSLSLRLETVLEHEGTAAIALKSGHDARIVAERPIRTENHLDVQGHGPDGGALEIRDEIRCTRLLLTSQATLLMNTPRRAFSSSLSSRSGTLLIQRDTDAGVTLLQFGGTLAVRLFGAGENDATVAFGDATRGGLVRLLPPADDSRGSLTVQVQSILSNAGRIQAPAINVAGNTFLDLMSDQELPTSADRAAGIHGEGGLRKTVASGRGAKAVGIIGEKNTYTGGTFIEAGTLRLASAIIPDTELPDPEPVEYSGHLGPGPLHIAAGAAFDLAGLEQTVESLHGEGDILLNGGTLGVADPEASTFEGSVQGPGTLVEGDTERRVAGAD